MDKMLTAISKYPNGTPLMIEWSDGGIVSGEIDTIYEHTMIWSLKTLTIRNFTPALFW